MSFRPFNPFRPFGGSVRIGPVYEWDTDAATYLNAGVALDGQQLEEAVAKAMNEKLFIAPKQTPSPIAGTLWESWLAGTAINLSGWRTLGAMLLPLHSSMPSTMGINFVQGDCNRKAGMKGDGESKYIDTGLLDGSNPLNDYHQSVWVSEVGNTLSRGLIGSGTGQNGATHLLSNTGVRSRTASPVFSSAGNPNKFFGASRQDAATVLVRNNSVSDTRAMASVELPTGNKTLIFSRGRAALSSASDSRLAWASEGRAIDLVACDAILTSYMAAIAAALS